ncbi:hypothetical protein HOLleu_25527 [Holothuria leucospilota]|uniref:Uncharacterized protein n=1 Tax=Holothuria leucospilota TaxID=206669 RepID=A0A9Q1BT01_HOLLE|nr:hypothetical protein HOLleu_25527 [Holothuria leucospilota]
METHISGQKCKFDMRVVLFRDLRTKIRTRYRKFHCSKRLARVHFYNAFYSRRIHFSVYYPEYLTHISARSGNKRASCFPVVSA